MTKGVTHLIDFALGGANVCKVFSQGQCVLENLKRKSAALYIEVHGQWKSICDDVDQMYLCWKIGASFEMLKFID